MIMAVEFPLEPFNSAVRDGSAGQKMQKILEAIKPEAAYFHDNHGKRGGTLIVNLDNAADIPALAEPWFLTFNAHIELHPVMTPDDLGRSGLDTMGKKWA